MLQQTVFIENLENKNFYPSVDVRLQWVGSFSIVAAIVHTRASVHSYDDCTRTHETTLF